MQNSNNTEIEKTNFVKSDEIETEQFANAYGFEHWPNECCQDCY